jgi:flagellar capping protein FliD
VLINEIDITTHSITGLTLSLQSLGEQTIEITPNLTEAKKSIQDFVEKYNQYTTFVTEKTENKIVNGKVVKAPLNDRPEAIQLRNAIRRIITQTQVENPTIKTVEALGLSPSTKNIKDPKLYLNETRLSQILTESPQETLVLLETVSQSLQNTLEPNVNPVIKQQNTGSIKTSQDALRNEKSRLQEAQNKRMAEIEKLTLKYELQMMQAEEAQQNMMQALTMLQQAQAKF